jgi:hypothetical protein
MKDRFPSGRELLFFGLIAVVCAVIVGLTGKTDVGLAVAGAPIFLVGAMMGLRRSDRSESSQSSESKE